MPQRLENIDIARALCVIWIVCFWHMNQYLLDDLKFFQPDTYTREVAVNFQMEFLLCLQ